MTINDLVDRLVEHIGAALAEVRMEPSEGGAPRAPALVAGWIPPKRSASEPRPPLVLVRPVRGSDADDGSRVTVQLLFVTHSEDAAGWRDLGNLIQRVRSSLTETRTLGPFHLDLPLEWEIWDDQALPEWSGRILTTWTQPRAEWLGQTE